MAQEKRKSNGSTVQKVNRPAKRQRVSDAKPQDATKSEADAGKPAKMKLAGATSISMLRKEEPEFLRGGGDLLSPLERKQIQAKATRDVLFEHRTGAAASDPSEGEDGLSDDREAVQRLPYPKKSGKSGRNRNTKGPRESENHGVRVEGLNYKVRWPPSHVAIST